VDQFNEKIAVITGAGSGLGRGMALHAAGEGMRVVVADVEEPALAETVALVEEAGAEVLGVPTDVSDPAAVDALADAAFDRFGAVHFLHNNAGVFQAGVSWQRTLDDWEWVMRVNFWGVLHGIKAFVPRLLEQEQAGDGDIHIVNTSSSAGLTTAALTECLAHDLRATGSSIGVSCLVPGAVATKIAQSTRNRPDEPPSEAQAPDHWFVADSLDQMLNDRGRTPLDAARIVFDGVRARQFWISTAEEDGYQSVLRARYDAILEHQLAPGAVYS